MKPRLITFEFVIALYTGLLWAVVLPAAPQCARFAIPLDLYSSKDQLKVTGSWLTMEPEGTFQTNISLRNQTGKSLSGLTVMVDYLDENDSILFSIPYVAYTAVEKSEMRYVHTPAETMLKEPVKPNAEIGLLGRNLLSITKLPASAEVVYWEGKFYEDGSGESSQIGQRGFRTDPFLVETPSPYLQLSQPHPPETVETLLKLRINEYGRVLDVQLGRQGDTALTAGQFGDLSRELFQWHFFPAIENGYAVESDLYMLVDFVPENPLPLKHCFLDHPDKYGAKFAFVTLQPVPNSKNWILYIAGIPAGGKLEPSIIEISPGGWHR